MIIDPQQIGALNRIVDHLRAGELVAIPTETVYGLAADASNPEAIHKIYELKKRPQDNPLIVHIADKALLTKWAVNIPDFVWLLVDAFWPGPLTLVLPKAPHVSTLLTAGQDTIAIRIPAHPITLEILKLFGGGLAAPSANPYTKISPTTSAHVARQFDSTLWIVEGGATEVGLESTILDCTHNPPLILRQGMVSAEDILLKTGIEVVDKQGISQIKHAGQALRHYAPDTPLKLFDPVTLQQKLNNLTTEHVAVLHYRDLDMSKSINVLRLPANPKGYAKGLYAALHQLDHEGYAEIWVELPPNEAAWQPIHERLIKASKVLA